LIIVHDGKSESFDGDLDDYALFIKEAFKKEEVSNPHSNAGGQLVTKELSKKEQRQLDAERRKQLQPLSSKLKKLEKKLDELTEKSDQLEKSLADPDIYLDQNKEKLKKILLAKSESDKALNIVESDWMEVSEEYETAMQTIG